MPTIAAYVFRHSHGLPYVLPRNDLDYVGNFVNMTFEIGGSFKREPRARARARDAVDPARRPRAELLHQCGARSRLLARRPVLGVRPGSRRCTARSTAARTRPCCGCWTRSATKKKVPDFIEEVKARHGRLMGFGHRVYKSYDPRAKLVKEAADAVFAETGRNPQLEIALELEKIALEDDYFVSRKLYPNVDFYSGLIYQAMGYPGLVLHRAVRDRPPSRLDRPVGGDARRPGQKIARPRQLYIGEDVREFVPIDRR